MRESLAIEKKQIILGGQLVAAVGIHVLCLWVGLYNTITWMSPAESFLPGSLVPGVATIQMGLFRNPTDIDTESKRPFSIWLPSPLRRADLLSLGAIYRRFAVTATVPHGSSQ